MSRKTYALIAATSVLSSTLATVHLLARQFGVHPLSLELHHGVADGFRDGSASWNACAEAGIDHWNIVLKPTAAGFTVREETTGVPALFDTINSVAFAENILGIPFGPQLLSAVYSTIRGRHGTPSIIEVD